MELSPLARTGLPLAWLLADLTARAGSRDTVHAWAPLMCKLRKACHGSSCRTQQRRRQPKLQKSCSTGLEASRPPAYASPIMWCSVAACPVAPALAFSIAASARTPKVMTAAASSVCAHTMNGVQCRETQFRKTLPAGMTGDAGSDSQIWLARATASLDEHTAPPAAGHQTQTCGCRAADLQSCIGGKGTTLSGSHDATKARRCRLGTCGRRGRVHRTLEPLQVQVHYP